MEFSVQDGRQHMAKFMLSYKFALAEMTTKIDILREEFRLIHDYNPIEHVNSRLKSPESILQKVEKKGLEMTLEAIEANIHDIAGVRIVCSFEEDLYRVANMLCAQRDVKVVAQKDYIANPKDNGYRSLHVIVKIPVFLSDGMREVFVELQLRTIAMDFWASLEHKIYYKYEKDVPARIRTELQEAAEQAAALDRKMARLNEEINILKELDGTNDTSLGKYIRDFVQANMK
ncbi:MAG: GTP pyrophosphokinase family protein [Caryophanon sp.]|nr:GTP pyrophosphokinase family protein [Caryophanon sp.]